MRMHFYCRCFKKWKRFEEICKSRSSKILSICNKIRNAPQKDFNFESTLTKFTVIYVTCMLRHKRYFVTRFHSKRVIIHRILHLYIIWFYTFIPSIKFLRKYITKLNSHYWCLMINICKPFLNCYGRQFSAPEIQPNNSCMQNQQIQ